MNIDAHKASDFVMYEAANLVAVYRLDPQFGDWDREASFRLAYRASAFAKQASKNGDSYMLIDGRDPDKGQRWWYINGHEYHAYPED